MHGTIEQVRMPGAETERLALARAEQEAEGGAGGFGRVIVRTVGRIVVLSPLPSDL